MLTKSNPATRCLRCATAVLTLICMLVTLLVSSGCTDPVDSDDRSFKPSVTPGTASDITANEIQIMSYNVAADESDLAVRGPLMINAVISRMPDSVGFQEARPMWKACLIEGLSDYYDYVGVSADGEDSLIHSFGNFIFYRKDIYEVVDSGDFWLSKTPDVPSIYPGADCNRYCTWVILRNKETKSCYAHVNCHLDWKSNDTTTFGARLVRNQMDIFASLNIPVVATGDFNDTESSEMYSIMTNGNISDARRTAPVTTDKGTYNNFSDSTEGREAILDYIYYTSDSISASEFTVCDERPNGTYISDHYGVFAKLRITTTCDSIPMYDSPSDISTAPEGVTAPHFEEGAEISITSIYTTNIRYAFAAAIDDYGIRSYKFRLYDSQDNLLREEDIMTLDYWGDTQITRRFWLRSLEPSTAYKFDVIAVNIFGVESDPLTVSFTTADAT